MPVVTKFDERLRYAGQILIAQVPTEPLVDVSAPLYRLCIRVYEIDGDVLRARGKATCLFGGGNGGVLFSATRLSAESANDIVTNLPDRWFRMRFGGQVPSGRQEIHPVGPFTPAPYRLDESLVQGERVGFQWLTAQLGQSESFWRRFVDDWADTFPGLVTRRGARRDRHIAPHVLLRALRHAGREPLAAKLASIS